MGTDLQTQSNALPVNVKDMAKALAGSATDAGAGDGTEIYLKFSKGDWSYGIEEEEPEEDSLWAINPFQCEHGWIAWGAENTEQQGRVLGERMVSATETLPSENDLPDVGGNWSKVVAMQLKCVKGSDEGIQVVFKTNSHGGRQLYSKMLKAIVQRIEGGDDSIVPVVTLGVDSYKNAKYGKIYTPQMEIDHWATMDGATSAADSEEDAEPETDEQPAPKRETRRRRVSAG